MGIGRQEHRLGVTRQDLAPPCAGIGRTIPGHKTRRTGKDVSTFMDVSTYVDTLICPTNVTVQIYRCTDLQMYRFTDVQIYRCTDLQVYRFTSLRRGGRART